MSDAITRQDLSAVADGLHENIKESTREVISYVQESQAKQDKKIEAVATDVKELRDDMKKVKHAVVDLLATDRHLHNLVRELKAEGYRVDESKVFA